MSKVDRLLHLIGRCDYGPYAREQDCILASIDLTKMREMRSDRTFHLTEKMCKEAASNLRRHKVDCLTAESPAGRLDRARAAGTIK